MSVFENWRKLVKDVQGGKLKPIYLLHGEEGYFIDRLCEEIEQHALQEHERDFNLTKVYGKDTTPDQVKDACIRFPMMAERQVVLLREAQAWRIDAFDKLAGYFKDPTPTTVLVIAYRHKKVDARRSWVKDVAKKGVLFHSEKLKEDKLGAWIKGYVASKKRKIGPMEAQLLADHMGSDLSKMAKEVEKLCIVVEEGGTITADAIQRIVGISKDYNIFELQNAIGARDLVKAQTIAHVFASAPKDHPLPMTLHLLNGYFSKLAVVHEAQGRDRNELAAMIKVAPYFVKDYASAARNYSKEQLGRIQAHLRDTDLRSKGLGNWSASDGDLLRELLVKVMA